MSASRLKSRIRNVIDPRVAASMDRSASRVASRLMQFSLFWPHDHQSGSYARPVATVPATELAVPPRELWASYCTSDESFLTSGREDCEQMRKLLAGSGAPIEDAGRILDLGCAAGRMIRHLADLTPAAEIWGCDIWSSAIMWCQDALSPPFRFAATTMVPHLPFEDRSFDLVYGGSLFTHIDDLADTWFLELHRIIRPGGRLYFSVNDQYAARIFDGDGDPAAYPRYWERTGGKSSWDEFVRMLSASPEYLRFRRGDAWMITLGRSMQAHVLWNSDVLCDRLTWGYRRCSVIPAAYGHQTGILLERI